jgi:hypothetical protein
VGVPAGKLRETEDPLSLRVRRKRRTRCETETTTRRVLHRVGSPLFSRCLKCGAENSPSSAFCKDCGVALAVTRHVPLPVHLELLPQRPPEIRITPEQPDPSTAIERKTVTALFADIKGSTELMEDLDPEEAREILDPPFRIIVDAGRHYESCVVQSTVSDSIGLATLRRELLCDRASTELEREAIKKF